jgi:hypothetical protein
MSEVILLLVVRLAPLGLLLVVGTLLQSQGRAKRKERDGR